MGTDLIDHSNHDIVEKMSGNYNIVDSTLNFAAAPIGNRPKVGVATGHHQMIEILLVLQLHQVSVEESLIDLVLRVVILMHMLANYAIDDISQQFDGQRK